MGTVGNDNCQGYRFLYLPAAWQITEGFYNHPDSFGGYNFGTTNTTFLNVAREYSSASPDVTWETAVKQNYGFDMRLWKDRISINFDYFHENRKDILINNESMIQAPTALRPSYINYGRVKNHGYEITMKYADKIGNDFRFEISPSISYSKNKIIEQAEIKRADKLVKATSYMGQLLGLTEDACRPTGPTIQATPSVNVRDISFLSSTNRERLRNAIWQPTAKSCLHSW